LIVGCVWAAPTAAAQAATCPRADAINVPGAERQQHACLDDMTTAGTRLTTYTDISEWAQLVPLEQRNPCCVPGLQIDGYMPDDSTSNYTHGWFHDSQFVIRLPNAWNGKLVVTGAPGTRKQYAVDPLISDYVLSKGYAFAATDKGNGGVTFYNDGVEPGDAGVEWNHRVTELAIAAKSVVRQRYGRAPERTYVTGISQGGYLTRWQIENRPDLYDGGVDWEGTLWTPDYPNVFTYLPAALRNYPLYAATGDAGAHDAMIRAGFAPGSEFLWPDHYAVYWDLTQRSYREEFDPSYDGELSGGIPFCQSGTPSCDADYDYTQRLDTAGKALARVANTGKIGKPMISLHGTLDSLLPITINGDPYRRMIERQGRQAMHRYWVIEHGQHVDGRVDLFPAQVRPIWPCWTRAFDALVDWVEEGTEPPPDQYLPDDRRGIDVVNECEMAPGPDAIAPGPLTAPENQVMRTHPVAVSAKVAPRRDRKKPYRFKVSGEITLPEGLKPIQACGAGFVRVTIGKTVKRAPIDAQCRYSVKLKVKRKGAARMTARWLGNRALDARSAKSLRVRAGRP
jgi:hypothetical protein